jgi:hypothetical protein
MFGNAIAASAALALTLAPVAVQAAPQEVSRVGSDVAAAEEVRGTTMWIVAAIALGLIIWGIIELTGDDSPTSP